MSLPLPATAPPQYADEKQALVPDSESTTSDVEGCQNHTCPHGHRRGHGHGEHKHKHKRRGILIKAFVLFTVLFGLGKLAGKAIGHHHRRHRHRHQHHGPGQMLIHEHGLPHIFVESMDADLHPDITLEHCVNWSSPSSAHPISPSPLDLFKHSTEHAEFTLPLTSPSLQILSHGPSLGSFRIVQDAEGESADGVRVEVLAKYRGKRAVEHVKVCSFTRKDASEGLVEGEEGHGVVILSPGSPHPRSPRIGFEIIVHLPPTSSPGNKLYINKFETNLPHFAHVISSLGSTVEFGEVVFRSGIMPVVAEYLSAAKVIIKTFNSVIEGNFSASEKLELHTSNGRIRANVVLENDPEQGVANLVLVNSHGPIDATITLTSTSPISGVYSINAINHNSPITLTFPPSTPSSLPPTLLLTAHTRHAPIAVALPPTFTGNFSASTGTRIPGLKPQVVIVNEEGDERKVEFEQEGKGRVEGSVWFEDEGEGRGNVRVSTVFAPAVLRI